MTRNGTLASGIEGTVAGRFELVARAGGVRRSVRRSFAALDANPASRRNSTQSESFNCLPGLLSKRTHRSSSSEWQSSRWLWPCLRSL